MGINIPKDKLWKYRLVFGSDYVRGAKKSDVCLDDFLSNAPDDKFWVNSDRSVVVGVDSAKMRDFFGELTPVLLKDAFAEFGIDVLEEARERLYCVIKK